MEIALPLIVLATAAGYYRLGFSAGLAWCVITILALVLFWPLGVLIMLAVMGYGARGMFGAVRFRRQARVS